MRGADVMQTSLFTVKRLEDFVPRRHPLRDIRELLNTALRQMDANFNAMYAERGRYSIASENSCVILPSNNGHAAKRAVVPQTPAG